MNGKTQSISVAELAQAVDHAVAQAAERHEKFRDVQHRGGIVLQPWILGFILQDHSRLDQATLAEAREFSTTVASQLSGVGGIGDTGRGAAFVLDRDIICGFFPQQAFNIFKG